LNIKKYYGKQALSVFIAPPSIEELRNRLQKRNTDSAEMIEKRIAKAQFEMSFSPQFDVIIVNEKLEKALEESEKILKEFLNRKE
jgi:guanylate kinase